jgi:1,4-alpha-glucan branching enzyme
MSGELAIVLHTHMPYMEGGRDWPVELDAYLRSPRGFGTWPFGEELLFEAIASCYVPLLDVLDRHPGQVTLSLTPVLGDQLAHPGAIDRCLRFLTELRLLTHRLDADELCASGEPAAADELERSADEYASVAQRLAAMRDGPGRSGAADGSDEPGGLLGALGRHVSWTSSATHAILPLLATETGIALQLQTGIESHRRRFGGRDGGLWLPECAYAPWLDPALERAGVRAACVELTNAFGLGSERHLTPMRSADGPLLWPIDRAMIALAWGPGGYPSRPPYRDYHAYTTHRHRVRRIDGGPYDHVAAVRQARADAAEFVTAARERVRHGGTSVFAIDTELLGHWWYEGLHWLDAVLDEADRQGLAVTTLDAAREHHEPVPAPAGLGSTSWGEGGDLRTWSGPKVAAFAWRARAAELALTATPADQVTDRALRELLALQSSDWAFLADWELAGDYPEQRAQLHAEALARELRDPGAHGPEIRGLAPWLAGWS